MSLMKKAIILLFILALGFLFNITTISALSVAPAKVVLSGDPGDSIEFQMKIGNDLDRTETFYPSYERYTTTAEEPIFIPDKTGLASWIITVPDKLEIGPKESKDVTVRVNIPQDAEPGGHYAAVFWSASVPKGDKGGGVGIMTRVAVLVLLDVSGDVIDEGNLISFNAIASKKLFTRLPIGFTYTIENKGTTHIGPIGKVIIKNIFGMTSAILDVNPQRLHALPGATRTFPTQNWEPEGGIPVTVSKGFIDELKKEITGFALGYYTANLNVEYGKENLKTINGTYSFWVLPWRVLIFIIIFLSIVLFGIARAINSYNKWVIKKARESLVEMQKEKNTEGIISEKKQGKK